MDDWLCRLDLDVFKQGQNLVQLLPIKYLV